MTPDPKADVKRFFQLLDTTEESDSGNVFHPLQFSCCRVLMTAEVEAIFKRLKEWANHVERSRKGVSPA